MLATEKATALKVSYRCPRCHHPVKTDTLAPRSKKPVEQPASLLGAIAGMMSSLIELPELDAGIQSTHCPHCNADFPCSEVEELQGEVLLSCPHCRHTTLSAPVGASKVVTCGKCKRGYTAGMVANRKGFLLAGKSQPLSPPKAGELRVRFECVQSTHCFEYGAGVGNQMSDHVLKQSFELGLVDAVNGIGKTEVRCPCCEVPLEFKVQSIASAEQSVAATRKLAAFGIWGLLAIPLAAAYFVIRWLLGSDFEQTTPQDLGVAVAGILLTLIGLCSLNFRSQGYRTTALLPASRTTLRAEKGEHSLWRTSGMSTKGARLEISHQVLGVEPMNSPNPAASTR